MEKKDYLLYFKRGDAWMVVPVEQADEMTVNAIVSNIMAQEDAESCQIAEVIRTITLKVIDQDDTEKTS